SGGMQRRVSIARALSTEPEIMLYDSPTGGLDPITATNIMEQIIKLRDLSHVTALLVSHRLQDGFLMATHVWDAAANALRPDPAAATATSFAVLHNQRVVFDGSANALRTSPDAYLRTFLAGVAA
ncbi:MAG TPA: ATP-binding cassette domain-containing protein, partial [Terriglobales bacterium]|nr:ATP-binding cassette domain-containing protein [Terriglobales bacterium]